MSHKRYTVTPSGCDGYDNRVLDTTTDHWDVVALTCDRGDDAEENPIGDDGLGRRIAACLNACQGIPTAELEQGIVQELVEQIELLAASHDEDAERLLPRLQPEST